MKISLNPTYYCNFDCSFCYLTKAQLRDPKMIFLGDLDWRLAEVAEHKTISHIDLYGGEIALISPDQYYAMRDVIRQYYTGKINIITNLSKVPEFFLDDDVDLSVSYDFDARQAHKSVRNNMLMLTKPFSILMLASPELMRKDVDQMITELNMYAHLASVEIKPYSSNQANAFDISYTEFEEFIKAWINSPVKKNFEFVNEFLIQDVIEGFGHSLSDDHVYITPEGQFGVLEFDANDNEYFLELESFTHYLDWTLVEADRVARNSFCNSCEYFEKCLSEHLRDVKDLSKSCNGFKNLIDWYKNEKLES